MDDNEYCSNCALWHYDRWTEEHYGMGVGICQGDGSPTFCSRHDCLCHVPKEDNNELR